MRANVGIGAAAVVSVLAVAGVAWGQATPPSAPQQQPAEPPPAAQPATPPADQAAPPAAEPSPEQVEAARAAYAQGQALFAEGKYVEAKAAFEQAYAAVPNPVVLVSIAECDVRLGNLEAAHDTLQRYLSARPDAPDRAEIEARIAELLATPATLVLTSEPAGAAIHVDGQDTGKTTPAEIPVARGEHQVEFVLAGYDPASGRVATRLGARHELHVQLQLTPVAPPPGPAPLPSDRATQPQGPPTTALWISGIVGAAGIVTGTVLGFMVLAEQSDFDANPTAETADRGERLALFTDVAFGVGAMALLTGAVIYLTADETATEDAGTVRVVPAASPNSAGVIARTRF